MSQKNIEGEAPGILPVLRAFIEQNRRFDIDSLDETAFTTALNGGAGSILTYTTAHCESLTRSSRCDEARAADLTMRMLTAEMLDCLEQIVRAAREEGVELTLLKGCAAALRYYPEPHLRTMGDVDVLVADTQREALERRVRKLGFDQAGDPREVLTRDHHHSLPFRHPSHGLYLEVHTRPYPPKSPLHDAAKFSYSAVTKRLESVVIGAEAACTMTHEQQLVYTATRWAEMINAERGVFPLLDAALLLRSCDGQLDWEEVCDRADEPWAAGALLLMLTYLDRWSLARVPGSVLSRLGRRDEVTNAAVRRLLHALVTTYVMQGRPPGPLLTTSMRRTIWSTLAAAKPPWRKLLELPVNVLFPPDNPARFAPSRIIRRIGQVVRGRRQTSLV